ncbi:hypothetical protein DRV84_13835 [Rhodosalinus sediminis]|uniref:Peptidase S8/S53 domain-containing protein n=1 Tax=Rhodosalinus sediminis TaxID=1940533 RepID=A0A3D9BLV9_9RHOB|nr:S8/S53 family peptidase [Rhodosalinus sediminis]REC54402.1 hypothetical protein DRV84_13835 [Rhodosalinus sediminis]
MIELTCTDEKGNPVFGYVELVEPDGTIDFGQTDDHGVVRGYGRYRTATIKPMDGHWNVLVGPLDDVERAEVVCPTLERNHALNWWRRLLCPDCDGTGRGAGVRVGVIDIPFQPGEGMMHIDCYDVDGDRLNTSELAYHSHGYRVCKTISERGTASHRKGLAREAELIFVDISDDATKSTWDFDKIGPAIELLVDEFSVDVINISGGSYAANNEEWKEISEFLGEYIGDAFNKGVVIFAAVGNSAVNGVALPAGMETVMGVGAVGLCGVAPSATLMGAYERMASDAEGATGALPTGAKIFHYLDSGQGSGLNLVGPGIGVFMEMDGGVLAEYEGTSYACPAVAATVAGALAEATGNQQERINERHKLASELIRSICVDLGMDRARQGWGLPILKQASIKGE